MRSSKVATTPIAIVFMAAVPAVAAEFRVIDIGVNTSPQAINAKGEIAGTIFYDAFGNFHAFKYGVNGLVDLGTLGGRSSTGHGINDAGLVVGRADLSNGTQQAFISNGLGMTGLGTLGGYNSIAYGINSANLIVGEADTTGGVQHAFIRDGVLHDLGALGGDTSTALAINASGVIVGHADIPNYGFHAFKHTGIGSLLPSDDLGALGGSFSEALAINDVGIVVGDADLASGDTHAFMFVNLKLVDLGTLPGHTDSSAAAINNNGVIVGQSRKGLPGRGFIYRSGQMIDLNDLLPANSGWVLNTANGINDNGQIVGVGTYNNESHGFRLDPIAAPLSIACPAGSGTLHTPYASAFSASGGTPPYASFAISSGALPPGLMLNPSGGVTGTPTQAGTFSFTGTVTDSNGSTGTANCSITIVPTMITGTLQLCADNSCRNPASPSQLSQLSVPPSRLPRPIVRCKLITYQPQTLPLQIGCFDSQSGNSIQNCNANLSLAPVPYSGGHDHDDPTRPTGSLDVSSGSTGSSGLVLNFTAPEVSGQVTLSLSGTQVDGTPLVPSTITIDVKVLGLAATPTSPYYSLTGATPIHLNNHFALSNVNASLAAIAQDFASAFPGSTLLYNDFSLVEGGIFDIDANANTSGVGNWAPPHCGHLSLGGGTNNADIMISGYSQTNSVPKSVYSTLKDIVTKHNGTICVTHSDHYHLCF